MPPEKRSPAFSAIEAPILLHVPQGLRQTLHNSLALACCASISVFSGATPTSTISVNAVQQSPRLTEPRLPQYLGSKEEISDAHMHATEAISFLDSADPTSATSSNIGRGRWSCSSLLARQPLPSHPRVRIAIAAADCLPVKKTLYPPN